MGNCKTQTGGLPEAPKGDGKPTPLLNCVQLVLLRKDILRDNFLPSEKWNLHGCRLSPTSMALVRGCRELHCLDMRDEPVVKADWKHYNPSASEDELENARGMARKIIELAERERWMETGGQILIRGKNQWHPQRGETFVLIPCTRPDFIPSFTFTDKDGKEYHGFEACSRPGEDDPLPDGERCFARTPLEQCKKNREKKLFSAALSGTLTGQNTSPDVAVAAVSGYENWSEDGKIVRVRQDDFRRVVGILPRESVRQVLSRCI